MNNPTQVLQSFIDNQANVLKETVQEIESAPMQCKGHYDKYMLLIGECNKIKHSTKLWALVLLRAGANPEGVHAAVKLLD